MRMAPVSASPWPSKPPTVARPQAERPVPPPPSPSKARWNELPSSSSRPVTERTGEPPLAAGLSQAPPYRSGHAPGAVTPLAAAPPGAPKARARPIIASARTALSPVPERSMLCPPSVICAPTSGADSRPATASTTWSATVRPKRDSHIFCNGSLFDTVPVASAYRNGLVVVAKLTQASGYAEREAALEMVQGLGGARRITLGGDKGYDAKSFVQALRAWSVTPHVAQNTTRRRSAIDRRTTGHPGYEVSQRFRKRVEEVFGWMKTVGLMRKTRHRGTDRVGWVFTFTAAAYNLVRIRNLLEAT